MCWLVTNSSPKLGEGDPKGGGVCLSQIYLFILSPFSVRQHYGHDEHEDVLALGGLFSVVEGEDDAGTAGVRKLDEDLLCVEVRHHFGEEASVETYFHRVALIAARYCLLSLVRELKVFG